MEKNKERGKDKFRSGTSRAELENAVLVKMKSVTGAEDDLCIAMLEENSYDLKTSIEAFYQQR